MEHMLQHNVMLFPSADNKMVIVTIVDVDFINNQLPEEHKKDNISFAMGITRIGIDGVITMKIDTKGVIEGEEWGKKCDCDRITGMGISGIITSPLWFCQKVKDYFAGLM